MDPNQADADQKLQFLRGYIEKQLSAGKTPSTVFHDLIGRKVPAKLAKEMISSVLDARQAAVSPPPSSPDQGSEQPPVAETPPPDRRTRIKIFIRNCLAEGRSEKEILALLLQRQVSRSEALDLIHDALEEPIPAAVSSGARVSPDIAPELPAGSVSAVLPPIDNVRAISEYVQSQLALGVGQKDLVDKLEGHGMSRNQAVDVVVAVGELNQRQLNEAVSQGGRTKRQQAGRKLLIGAAFLIGGACITLVSFMLAEDGGTYWLFYGPMIYGLFMLVSGVIDWARGQ